MSKTVIRCWKHCLLINELICDISGIYIYCQLINYNKEINFSRFLIVRSINFISLFFQFQLTMNTDKVWYNLDPPTLLASELYSDLVITTSDGSNIKAHKFMLAAAFPALEDALLDGDSIVLPNYNSQHVKELLDIVYGVQMDMSSNLLFKALSNFRPCFGARIKVIKAIIRLQNMLYLNLNFRKSHVLRWSPMVEWMMRKWISLQRLELSRTVSIQKISLTLRNIVS